MLGASAAVAVATVAGSALAGEEAQALALFRQLNPHRQEISLMTMRAFLDTQRHNESMGWAEEPPKPAYSWEAKNAQETGEARS